jgi:hypothetical protein
MFIGHFALGFAFKKVDARVSLATTFLAAQLADTVWPVFVLAGVERVSVDPGNTAMTPLDFESYPWSHSLLTLGGLAACFAVVHYLKRRRPRTAILLGALVLSHWVLDVLTHRPDMPVTPWSQDKLGLGLWNSVAGTVAVETVLFAAGIALALKATRARDGIGRWGFAGLVLLLGLIYVANLLGPPPPGPKAIGIASLALMLVLFPLVAWIDRHRRPRSERT